MPVAATVPVGQSGLVQPTGAGFDLVLLAHVACVVVALVSVALSGVQAARLLVLATGTRPSAGLVRYYAPGVNWPGRAVYGVPAFGFALLGLSHQAYGIGDGWVLSGLVLWVGAAVLAEGVLWPAERQVQAGVALAEGMAEAAVGRVPGPVADPAAGGLDGAPDRAAADVRRSCRVVVASAATVVAILMVAVVLMVAQP